MVGSPYKFNREDAIRFANEYGAKTKTRGDELQLIDCPYCHGSSRGDKYSFSINLKTGQFKCLRASCSVKGNMLTLHKDFNFDLGTDLREYERPSYTWKRFKKPTEPIEPKPSAIKYLTSRGISEEVIRKFEITTKKDNDNLIVFPFFDENEDLVSIKYRNIEPDAKAKEFSEKDCKAILFGMKQCVPDEPLIITEGQIDSLSVATAGYNNTISVPTGKNGMTWIPHCWDWLHRFTEIIVFGDYERDEITLLSDIRSRLDWMRVRSVRPIDYRDCKDANELLQKHGIEAIKEAIENAELEKNEEIIDLADIQYSKDDDKDILPIGINDIDNALHGGLHFGFMDILTGKRGEGKSTFGSLVVKSAIENNVNSFIYSGEMRPSDVKRWLDFQIAGPNRVINTNGANAPYPNYTIMPEDIETISNWYRKKVYIYNANVLSEKHISLLDAMEKAFTQYGCRFALIDNLMTAIDTVDVPGNKLERQEYLVKRFAEMAIKYNVLILLIAHKKKTDPKYQSDENDDVLGSSEITNLAGVVMSYGKRKVNNEIIDGQGVFKITKNRLTGEYFEKELFFDKPSKRIYVYPSELNEDSACFLDANGFSANIPEDIPF